MVDTAGKPITGTPCYNNPDALRMMDESVTRMVTTWKADPAIRYGHMGDETDFPLCRCEYCRKAFRAQYGEDIPEVKDDFSPAYLDRWIDYQLFRNAAIGAMYARAVRDAHAVNPDIRMFASLPLSGGMCHGDDQFHTQSGFDLLWDHTYPGTMAIRVGLSGELLEETADLQGRPQVPIFDLLQAFDSYDRVPNMPPPEYMREMAWQAIGHGIDSVGWFVYNAMFWNMPGTEAWAGGGPPGP